jgi:hypothetical protein
MKTIMAAVAFVAAIAPAVAAEGDGPPWNIAGDNWLCKEGCPPGLKGKPMRVVQNGARFLFIDGTGSIEQAEWKFDYQISFIGCDNAAILSADHATLAFIDGKVWVR